MPIIRLGSTAVSKAYVGNTQATKIYLGNTQIWAASSFPYTLTPTHTDNFNRADATLDTVSSWDQASTLAKPRISSQRAIGSGDNNCRGTYTTEPKSTMGGQYFKADIYGINDRSGVVFDATSTSTSSWIVFTNTTTLTYGRTSSISSSNSGTIDGTITVPAVTTPCELLVCLKSAGSAAEIFLNRTLVGTITWTNSGTRGGIYVRNATDIVDNYEQGTFV